MPIGNGKSDVGLPERTDRCLVCTTVVSGVDVPNATVMIIEDAEMFGLAQLHQPRESGRSHHQSVPATPKTTLGAQRLRAFTVPGRIQIAEQDVLLRSGEPLGQRRSGYGSFLR